LAFGANFISSWIRIRIRIWNADPDPGEKFNADPDPKHCLTLFLFIICPQRHCHIFSTVLPPIKIL
jgi:hypothetical protein